MALPHVLPMGWKESPPNFSTSTETVADLANETIRVTNRLAPHRLDEASETRPKDEPKPITTTLDTAAKSPDKHTATPDSRRLNVQRHTRPTAYWDVYVDDFLGLCQGNKTRRQEVKRHLLHNLDKVFRTLEALDTPHGQEPASVKKLLKGDACWTARKVILGWLVDTMAMTLELPAHRIERLHKILLLLNPDRKRVAAKVWHQVMGELRSMAAVLPGARGLFSTMQEAFCYVDNHHRVKLNRSVHDFLADFWWLANDVASRPTRIAEVIPADPVTRGACDASGDGMGGVHFISGHNGQLVPLLWRQRLPTRVTNDLVS